MFRVWNFLLLPAGTALLVMMATAGGALAGMPSKGLKVDPLLQQAIIGTAQPEPEIPPAPMGPSEAFGPEEPALPVMADAPEPEPEVVAEDDDRFRFGWPEKPGRLWGGVMFLPSLLVKTGVNDNLFATDGDSRTDFVTSITPRLMVKIPDIRHEVELEGSWEYRQHINYNDEDRHNLKARLGGALVAEKGFSVPFEVSWAGTHEERYEDLVQDRPTGPLARDDFRMMSGLRFKPGPFGIALLGRYNKQRFEDGIGELTGAPVIRRDADRDITDYEFNTSFDLDPDNTLMLWGTYGTRDYERRNFQGGGFNGPRRSSDTFSGMLSWIFDYTGLEGHASFGANGYNYQDNALEDVREFVGDLEVDHQIGPKTSVNLQLARLIAEDVEIIDPMLRTRAGFYVDHQPWEDVLVAAGIDYSYEDFIASGRDDSGWDFRILADYFFNDFLALGAEYVYTQRDSTVAGLDFDRNMIMLRARGRL